MTAGDEKRFRALDGLRGIAVLEVAVLHCYLLSPLDAEWYRLLQRACLIIDGLTMFFVLSGFLIGGILLDAHGAEKKFRTFFARRFFRIMPLYFLLLATYGIVRFVDNRFHLGLIYYWYSEFPFWNYLVFFQNYRMIHEAAFGAPWLVVTWSLAVEQQFYLIVPVVLHYVRGRLLILLGVCCVLLAPLVRHGYIVNVRLADRLDALSIGVLLAWLVRKPWSVSLRDKSRRGSRAIVYVYFLTVAALRIANLDSPVLFSWTVTALIYALMILLLTDGTEWPVFKPAIELLAPVGLLSYFIYLFHTPVMYMFTAFVPQMKVAALPITIGLAALSYRYFERPLIRFGHRLNYDPPKIKTQLASKLPASSGGV